jgi:hypothetical protein
MKDLIIGSASNYSWDVVKYWVNSIRSSGFDGDVVITGTNFTKQTIEILEEKGVLVFSYGEKQKNGDVVSRNREVSHVERFFHIWNCLTRLETQYRYVITTDTRDVIFQTNPSHWLEKNLRLHKLVASSEGLKYRSEPWGNQNLHQTFSPYFYNMLKDRLIYNVGVIAGEYDTVKNLLILVFELAQNRPIPIVDQAIYNFLLQVSPYNSDTMFTTNKDAWSIQLGTTIEAVREGSGDLGIICKNDPSKFVRYQIDYEDVHPIIEDDMVCSENNIPFTIVHQYDRISSLKSKIEALYG